MEGGRRGFTVLLSAVGHVLLYRTLTLLEQDPALATLPNILSFLRSFLSKCGHFTACEFGNINFQFLAAIGDQLSVVCPRPGSVTHTSGAADWSSEVM